MPKPARKKLVRGLALVSRRKRTAIASHGGKTVVAKYGIDHMRQLGIKGGTNKARMNK